jgi:glycosyltransferase involved in cell wall biosynthesis
MPKISVIIPTYNRAEFVQSAIQSVLGQTFQDFEILVVDEISQALYSNDNTRDAVNSFGDRRVKYLRIERKGVSPARNLGITNSNGKYIAFLDDDDEWLPQKLKLQVDLLENSRSVIGGVYTGLVVVDRSTGLILRRVVPKKRGNLLDDLCIENCVGTASTVLLRRECLQKVGVFDEGIVFGEDYDLWIRISREFHFECIEEPLVRYSVHMNNSLSNHEKRISGIEALIKKYGPWFASNRKYHSHRYLSLGVAYCYNGNLTKGREALIKAIKIYPYQPRHYFNFGLSLLGAESFKKIKTAKEKL